MRDERQPGETQANWLCHYLTPFGDADLPLWRSFAAPYGYKTKGPDEMISKLLLALL